MLDVNFGIPGLIDFEEIGAGGFATVYSAFETEASRPVAVKVLRGVDETGRRRFERERRMFGRMSMHDNIVTLFRSGYTDPGDLPYLVMEYMPGGSLADRLTGPTRLSAEHAGELVLQIADALGFAHATGVLHKDVKPANILLVGTSRAKLTDFGVSAVRDSTGTSQIGFSLGYAAPETFHADAAPDGRIRDRRDERSDLYSLAATLYALVVGAEPFAAPTQASVIHGILHGEPRSTGSGALDRFFATGLAKTPADRFQNAAGFAEALRVAIGSDFADADGAENVRPVAPKSGLLGPDRNPDQGPRVTGSSGLGRRDRSTLLPVDLARPGPTIPVGGPPPLRSPINTPGPKPDSSLRKRWLTGVVGTAAAAALTVGAFLTWGPEEGDGVTTPIAGALSGSETASDDDVQAVGNRQVASSDAGADPAIDRTRVSTGDDEPQESEATDPDTNNPETNNPDTDESQDEAVADGALDPASASTSEDPSATASSSLAVDESSGTTARQPAEPAQGGTTTETSTRTQDGPTPSSSTTSTRNDNSGFAATPRLVGSRTWSPAVVATIKLDSGLLLTTQHPNLRIWDPDEPDRIIATFDHHSLQVDALLQLDNGLIASGGNRVRIWDPNAPDTTITEYRGHMTENGVSAITQLDNGLVASAGRSGPIHIWDPADPATTLAVFSGHTRGPEYLIQLRSGLMLSSPAVDSSEILLWNPNNPGSTVGRYRGHPEGLVSMAEVGNGLVASVSSDDRVHIWNPTDPSRAIAFYEGHDQYQGTPSILGLKSGLALSAGKGGRMHIWDPANPEDALFSFGVNEGWGDLIAELDDGRIVFSELRKTEIWDLDG